MPSEVRQFGPLASGIEAVLHINEPTAIGFCEQIGTIQHSPMIEQVSDYGDRFIAEWHTARRACLATVEGNFAPDKINAGQRKTEEFFFAEASFYRKDDGWPNVVGCRR